MKSLFMKINSNLHKFMAVPAILLYSIFFIYPLIKGIGLSFTDWNSVSAAHFIGFKNFINFVKDDRARNDVLNTVLFALGSAPLLNIVGFINALILDGTSKCKKIIRSIVYLPAVISPLIMGYIWYFILQPGKGFLPALGKLMNLHLLQSNWLGNRYNAIWVLILVNVWQYAGMTMVIYLAGLQSIPVEIYEASKIDGAGYFQTLFYITLPLIVHSIKINIITNIIGSLSVFDIVVALTDGGPGYSTETLSIYIMRMCYGSFTGYSTAVAIILFLIILIPVLISLKFMKSVEFEK